MQSMVLPTAYANDGQPVIFVFFCRGNNSAKNVGGVTVVNLCLSSGHALYLCQVS